MGSGELESVVDTAFLMQAIALITRDDCGGFVLVRGHLTETGSPPCTLTWNPSLESLLH